MDWQKAAENGEIDNLKDFSSLIDEDGAGPLHYAAQGGHENAVKALLEKFNLPPDSRDKYGRTPLYFAVSSGHLHITRLLLSRNATPDAVCQCGTTCISKAAENGHLEILDLLLAEGANWKTKNQDGESPKDLAMRNGHLPVIGSFEYRQLKRLGSFFDAIKDGRLKDMKDLMGRGGVDPGARRASGSSALDVAAQYNQIEAAYFLLYEIGKPTAELVQAVDSRGRSALYWAVVKGNVEMVELLLASGASLNARDKSGKNVLQYATGKRHGKVLEILQSWIESPLTK